eukprot:RCo050503
MPATPWLRGSLRRTLAGFALLGLALLVLVAMALPWNGPISAPMGEVGSVTPETSSGAFPHPTNRSLPAPQPPVEKAFGLDTASPRSLPAASPPSLPSCEGSSREKVMYYACTDLWVALREPLLGLEHVLNRTGSGVPVVDAYLSVVGGLSGLMI